MALFWMYLHGFHSITLIGGATAGIGDPTGRTKDRDKLSQHVRKANMVTMHYQLKALWMNVEKQGRVFGYEWEWAWRRGIHNNNTWWNSLPFLEVLRLLGSGTRVGTMLGRDTAKNKMESRDGLSFAEFSYPLLQAYDWWRMYSTFQLNGIQLQIGGSDQYGNIMAGVDAVNHIRRTHYSPLIRQEEDLFTNRPMGFTVPLLTTSAGEKFGKSAGNAIWLDKDMTSPFDFYQVLQDEIYRSYCVCADMSAQFFLRSADDDVRRYLNLFTFIPVQEIDQIMVEHESDASRRVAQRRLAREVLMMVHGDAEVKAVEAQHGILFKPSRTALKREARAARTPQEPEQKPTKPADLSPLLNGGAGPDKISPAGQVILPRSLVVNQQLGRVFYAAGLVSSRSEGHRLIAKQGAWIGSVAGPQHRAMPDHVEFTRAGNWTSDYINKFIIDDQLLIIRAGKWRVRVINIVADSEFERLGLDVSGWQDFKQSQQREAEGDAAIEGQKADRHSPSSDGPHNVPTQS
ncbi:MAG: hypothetical protein L6R37_006236 [Teloschistes peruensis]|nr:MAG: hypothetical protein L6R37_006236 [Teloschistes peruensis]